MAKLIAVCSKSPKDKPYKFEERQVPLEVEDNLKMVMQLPTIEKVQCNHKSDATQNKRFHCHVDSFAEKMELLSRDELAAALLIPSKDLFNSMIEENITCVGCRRSIEQMFKRLKDQGLVNALDPLVITSRSELSLNPSFLYSPWNTHSLFNIQGNKLTEILDTLPRGKKGSKRCALHSLDTHKSKPNGNWIEIWEALESACREEVTIIPASCLRVTMDAYLRKHRFCTECKSKVNRAFNILIGEVEPSKEKGYCAHLYDGLRCCPQQKHIHILSETNFIHKLIMRAEPEISGDRERHAKTIDVAQEEVLTCLGLHIYDKLYRIAQKLRAEEQTYHLLFHLGVVRLCKAFEVTVESKRGMTMLEQVCEEFNEADKLKQQKKELKKQRRKAKKKASKNGTPTDSSCLETSTLVDSCECGSGRAEKDGEPTKQCQHADSICKLQEENDMNDNVVPCEACDCGPDATIQNDCGYCTSSSPENSEVACNEGICNHDDDNAVCLEDCEDEIWPDCEFTAENYDKHHYQQCYQKSACGKEESESARSQPNNCATFTCLLQDMLDKGEFEDSGDFITEEDIINFKRQHRSLDRGVYRAKLERDFKKFCHGCGDWFHHNQKHSVDKCISTINKMKLNYCHSEHEDGLEVI